MEKLRTHFEIAIVWKAFPLHPETPPEGLLLKERYAARNIDPHQAMVRLRKAADEVGLPLAERERTYNTRLAQELGKWAEAKGKGDAFHDAVFRAYFAEAKNISDPAVLLGIAKALELPEAEAREALEKRTFRAAVDADWELSGRMGIDAVPTFVLGTAAIAGAQPYELLEQLLVGKGVKRIKSDGRS